MSPGELWLLIDAKRPPKMFGSLTEFDVEQLHEELIEMQKAERG